MNFPSGEVSKSQIKGVTKDPSPFVRPRTKVVKKGGGSNGNNLKEESFPNCSQLFPVFFFFFFQDF